jgi:hypothetical protein
MQNDFLLFIHLKLGFQSYFMVFFVFVFFFQVSRCMVTFLGNHLNFQNSVVLDKHKHVFCFCTKLWILKNPCEHVRSCIVLKEKGNIPKDSWRNGFMLKGYAQCVICMKQQKWKHVMNIGKHMILLTRKAHLTEKVLWYYELTHKTKTGWNKKSRSFEGMINQR